MPDDDDFGRLDNPMLGLAVALGVVLAACGGLALAGWLIGLAVTWATG